MNNRFLKITTVSLGIKGRYDYLTGWCDTERSLYYIGSKA
jgi:hypothetical protein